MTKAFLLFWRLWKEKWSGKKVQKRKVIIVTANFFEMCKPPKRKWLQLQVGSSVYWSKQKTIGGRDLRGTLPFHGVKVFFIWWANCFGKSFIYCSDFEKTSWVPFCSNLNIFTNEFEFSGCEKNKLQTWGFCRFFDCYCWSVVRNIVRNIVCICNPPKKYKKSQLFVTSNYGVNLQSHKHLKVLSLLTFVSWVSENATFCEKKH